jgi:plastocyanin
MTGSRLFAVLVLIVALSALMPAAPRVQAADVSVDLHAANITWHVGTETSTSTTITVNQGDTIRLRIVDHDAATPGHTFDAPQFGVSETLVPMGTIFVNITTDASDVGTWQFFCTPHSAGTYPSRTGMVGSIVVQSTAPPANNTLLYAGIGVVIVVIAVSAMAMRMRRKKPGGPGPGSPPQP